MLERNRDKDSKDARKINMGMDVMQTEEGSDWIKNLEQSEDKGEVKNNESSGKIGQISEAVNKNENGYGQKLEAEITKDVDMEKKKFTRSW